MFYMNKYFKNIYIVFIVALVGLFLFYYAIFIPKNPWSKDKIIFNATKGIGDDEIAIDLQKQDIINSNYAFRLFVIFSGNHSKLQAGSYEVSSNMSVFQIIKMFVDGKVLKDKITIPEGWDYADIENYLVKKNVCTKENFELVMNQNFADEFSFLNDKLKGTSLQGYIFPDTYEFLIGENCQQVVNKALVNFDKKLTINLREEIAKQKKSIHSIITMASIIEREVVSLEDRKIVSGILWQRIAIGMPLQVDVEPDTYKYYGLPKSPISNPGIDSIIAAIYPTKTQYLYYLSARDGKTIFSKTLQEHNIARAKYLK